MARTFEEILRQLELYKNTTALRDLQSVSRTAMYKLWMNIVADNTAKLEEEFDAFALEVESRIALQKPGRRNYYADVVLRYQDGDLLNPNTFEYDTIDISKRIIKRVAVIDAGEQVIIKVAKGEPLVALSAQEMVRLNQYISLVKFAGVDVAIISLPAAMLRLNAVLYYNGLIPENIAEQNTIAAITQYLNTVDFGGVFVRNDLINKIRQAEGVSDVKITLLKVMDETLVDIDQRYSPAPGYMFFDETNSNLTFEVL